MGANTTVFDPGTNVPVDSQKHRKNQEISRSQDLIFSSQLRNQNVGKNQGNQSVKTDNGGRGEIAEQNDLRLAVKAAKKPSLSSDQFNDAMLLTEYLEDRFVNPSNHQFKGIVDFKAKTIQSLNTVEQNCREQRTQIPGACNLFPIKFGVNLIPDSSVGIQTALVGAVVAPEVPALVRGVHWMYRETKVNRTLKNFEKDEKRFLIAFRKVKGGSQNLGI